MSNPYQNILESVLIAEARKQKYIQGRFSSFEERKYGVVTISRNLYMAETCIVVSKYLMGVDGARSEMVEAAVAYQTCSTLLGN